MKIGKLLFTIILLVIIQVGYMVYKFSSSGAKMEELLKGDFDALQSDDSRNSEKSDDGLFSKISKAMGFDKIGKQAPEWESGLFSPDGRYYVYTYRTVRITNYKRTGGSTFSSGIASYYFQVIDLETGKKLIDKPRKYKPLLNVMKIENNRVWFQAYYAGDGYQSVGLYNIGDQDMEIKPDEMLTINSDILSKEKNSMVDFYENQTKEAGAVVEAKDGRQYLINPETGKMTKVSSNNERVKAGNWDSEQLDNRAEGDINATVGTRQRIVRGWGDRITQTSEDDFISPEFLKINKTGSISNAPMTQYKGGFFIFSQQNTSDTKNMTMSMLDYNTFKIRWSVDIPQKESFPIYRKEKFAMKDNLLYISNKSNLVVINVDSGEIVQNYEL